MINLSGLNFNFNLPESTVPSMTEQIGYTAPAQDTYVDLFGDTTAPDIGTLGPTLNLNSGNLLGFTNLDEQPTNTTDYLAQLNEELNNAVQGSSSFVDPNAEKFNFWNPATGTWQTQDSTTGAFTDMPGVDWSGGLIDLSSGFADLQDPANWESTDLTHLDKSYVDSLVGQKFPEYSQYYEGLKAQEIQARDSLGALRDSLMQEYGIDNSEVEGYTAADYADRAKKNAQLMQEVNSDPRYVEAQNTYDTLRSSNYDIYTELNNIESQLREAEHNSGFIPQLLNAAPMLMLAMAGVPTALGTAMGASGATASAIGGGMLSAGNTLAQGGSLEDALKAGATTGVLSAAGAELGGRVGAGVEAGINPFSEQAGLLADQAAGIGFVSPLATTAANVTDTFVRTGEIDPTAFISGDILQEFGASQVVGDAVDFTKAVAQDDYAAMLEIASDYVDLPEGDGLSFDTPEFLKEFDKEVLQPAKDMLEEAGGVLYEDVIKPAGQAVADVAEPIYEDVIKPLGDTVVDVAQAIDDEVIDPFVSTVQDTIIDPLQEAGQTVYEDVIQPVGQTVADVGEAVYEAQKPVGQAIADVATGVYDALPDVTIDLPSVDLPNINLPSIDWQGLFGALLAGSQGMFSGGGGVPGTSQASQDAIQTELLDYKPITPYRSKLSPSARLFG